MDVGPVFFSKKIRSRGWNFGPCQTELNTITARTSLWVACSQNFLIDNL